MTATEISLDDLLDEEDGGHCRGYVNSGNETKYPEPCPLRLGMGPVAECSTCLEAMLS